MGLVSSGQSEVILLGSRHSADTLRLRKFLTRNSYPFVSLDIDGDPGAQALLERFHVAVEDIPVVIDRGGRVLRNPAIREVAEVLQLNRTIDESSVYDLVVVGAGPAGLAAAVYAASEGLDVLVLEATAPGGQAGTSSRIENYLGFPTGISGQALASRALVQPQKFGANVNVACVAKRLECQRHPYSLELSDRRIVQASAVIIATGAHTGAKHRKPLPVHWHRRLLCSHPSGGEALRKRGGRHRGWRQFSGSGRCVSIRWLSPHAHTCPLRRAGRQHVTLPGSAH